MSGFGPGFAAIAERRIDEAIERGDLDGLPGTGRPLTLDDDRLVPPTLRMAWRVMRNAGVVPREVTLRGALVAAERALADAEDDDARRLASERLALLVTRLELSGGRVCRRRTPSRA